MGWQVFLKGADSKYFRFVGPYVSVALTQLCHGNGNTSIDNSEMNGHVSVLIKLYFQKHVATLQAIICQTLAQTVNKIIIQAFLWCLQVPWYKYFHHDELHATEAGVVSVILLCVYIVSVPYHTDTIDLHKTDIHNFRVQIIVK